MSAGHLSDALAFYRDIATESVPYDAGDAFGRYGRGVKLKDMLDLLHTGAVLSFCEHLAALLQGGEKGIHAQ